MPNRATRILRPLRRVLPRPADRHPAIGGSETAPETAALTWAGPALNLAQSGGPDPADHPCCATCSSSGCAANPEEIGRSTGIGGATGFELPLLRGGSGYPDEIWLHATITALGGLSVIFASTALWLATD